MSSLQLFYDTIEFHIRALRALGTKEESYEPMLIPTILSRLPWDVHTKILLVGMVTIHGLLPSLRMPS